MRPPCRRRGPQSRADPRAVQRCRAHSAARGTWPSGCESRTCWTTSSEIGNGRASPRSNSSFGYGDGSFRAGDGIASAGTSSVHVSSQVVILPPHVPHLIAPRRCVRFARSVSPSGQDILLQRVNAVVYAGESSSVLVSGSYDTTVRCWDCRSRNAAPIQTMAHAKARPAPPSSRDDKNTLSSGDGRDLVSLCPMLGVGTD